MRFIARNSPRLAGMLACAGIVWMLASSCALAQMSALRDEAMLGILILVGAIVYAACIFALFGRRWLVALVR